MKNSKKIFIYGLLLVGALVLGSFSRYIFSDIPNVTPILAMALFAGAMFRNKFMAYLIPVGAMVISDYFIGFHSTSWLVYLSFAMIAFLGTRAKKDSLSSVALYSVLASVLFFAVTNFGIWALGMWYPMSIEGLIECYALAVPFFRNTLLSTLGFSGVLFGVNYLMVNRVNSELVLSKNMK